MEWLIKLAKEPGWKDYSWSRAKELEKDSSGLWYGIASDLKNAMQKSSAEAKKAGE